MKNIKYFEVNQLKEVMKLDVSDSQLKRLAVQISSKKRQVHIHVAEDRDTGELWVVGGFDHYLVHQKYNEKLPIPCYFSSNTTKQERLLLLLRNLTGTDLGEAINKHKCISALFDLHKQKKRSIYQLINEYSGLSKDEIDFLLYHPEIPNHLKTEENKPRINLLNSIQTLKKDGIHKSVRDQLCYFAVENSNLRLTEDKLTVIKWLINQTSGFKQLPLGNQLYLIAFALEYKKYLLSYFQKVIDSAMENKQRSFFIDIKKSASAYAHERRAVEE
ncbi:hypothetical protein [Evansella tamaricis]|uniref:Uncharacterized protein n=1 Tax=Evansella tamaricis TaxID=2069301 RepID=A0ABS6JGN8_9BACI|nr:hypothetical protein [Evansella tamaricis]MBU9712560.1 hypothetical protein [Evansella tamaricis]